MVGATLWVVLFELIFYYLYESKHIENICFEEQVLFVLKWCCFNFIIAIITYFIPQIRQLNSFFWLNGIICPILFIYCTAQLC